ncbi:MAG: FAD-dependent oxidoreductase [Thermodesulfobacteriota bacterium]|nr:FAD-dependent oxidoreductase [Thermodesulfobacteriota bacterium]
MGAQVIDVVIIGAGPAGLQAAVHAVRKKASVLVLGKAGRSSIYSAHVENYLCVDGVTEGSEMLKVGREQVVRFGAEIAEEDALEIQKKDDFFLVRTETGKDVIARTLVLATGSTRSKLNVKGEKKLLGLGVSYCVDCDANFFRNVPVAVVGNESAAVDGALTLLGYASEVFLIAKKLFVSEELGRKLAGSKIKLMEGTWVKEILGDSELKGLLLEDDSTLTVEGVFIELGAKNAIELATTIDVQLDTETFSYIATDKKQATNIPGIYAAGDVAGPPHQMAKAVGEGCVAGWGAANFARIMKKRM